MIEKRSRATFNDLFPDGVVPLGRYFKEIVTFLNDPNDVMAEVSYAQWLVVARHELIADGSLEDLFRFNEINGRFYETMGAVEVSTEEELLQKQREMMNGRDPDLFSDYTRGAMETKKKLVPVSLKYGLPEPRALLVCLDFMRDDYLFTVPILVPAGEIRARFDGDLRGYLEYLLENAELTAGYSYKNDQLVEVLKARIASLS